MHPVAIAFWGAFFGTATLMLLGALAAFAQSHRRVALAGALSALVSAVYAVTYLGWLPVADAVRDARLVTHVGIFTAFVLGLMLLADLGLMRHTRLRRRLLGGALVLAAAAFGASWLLTPAQAVTYGTVVPLACAIAALPVALLSARRGDRIAWCGVFALAWLIVGLAGGFWIAHDREGASWVVHAVTASAGVAYLAGIAGMLWLRYSYLIELREVLAHGPRYDPVTRMRSDAASGRMLVQALQRRQHDPSAVVVVLSVTVANLAAVEHLHGRAALNHVLFVLASRLRRCVPAGIEMARASDDGFLLVDAHGRELPAVVRLGYSVAGSLSKPITLRGPGAVPGEREVQPAWVAEVGVGVLAATARAQASMLAGEARELARSACAVAGRVAWREHDPGSPWDASLLEAA